MTKEHNTALAVETRGLAFAYPVDSGEPAFGISWPDLRIDQGAFCVVVGSTGSGKTTLLRSLKPELVPAGAYRGWARVLGRVAEVGKTCGASKRLRRLNRRSRLAS